MNIIFSQVLLRATYCALLVFIGQISLAQSPKTLAKVFPNPGDEIIRAMILLKNQDVLLLGNSESYSANDDVFLMSVDSLGNLNWSKQYFKSGNQDGYDIIEAGNNFLLSGLEDQDGFLMELDSVGGINWYKEYGGNNGEYGRSLNTVAGGFVFSGYTSSSLSAGQNDFMLTRTDSSGVGLWTKAFGGTKNDFSHAMDLASNSDIVLAGYRRGYSNNWDAILMRIDSSGSLLWTNRYHANNDESFSDVIETSDMGLMMAGWTESFGAGSRDILLMKTDSAGNIQWSKTYGGAGFDSPNSVIETKDGSFVVVSRSASFSSGGDYDIILTKTDSAGNILWTKSYGDSGDEEVPALGKLVIEHPEGGFLIGGYSDSYGNGSSDFYLIKTDSAGIVDCCSRTVSLSTSNAPFSKISWSPNTNSTVWGSPSTVSLVADTPSVISTCTPLIPSLSPDTLICAGDTLTINSSDAVSQWYPQKWIISSDSFSLTVVPDSSITYFAELSFSSCLSSDTLQVNITVNHPTYNQFNDTTICSGDTVSIFAQTSVVEWFPKAGIIYSDSVQLTVAPVDTTTYYAISDSFSCNKIDTVYFNVNVLPTKGALYGDSLICQGDTLTLESNIEVTKWYPKKWLTVSDSLSLSVVPDSSITYYAILKGGICNGPDTVAFHVMVDIPDIYSFKDTSICSGDTISIQSSSPVFQWFPSKGIIASTDSQVILAPDTTVRYFAVSDSSFCFNKDTSSFEVRVYPLIEYLIADTSVCDGDTAVIYSNSAVAQWYPQKWVIASDSFSFTAIPDSSTTYYAKTAHNKCVNSDTISISINIYPNATISTSGDTIICETDTIQLFASGSANYSWSPGYSLDDSTIANPLVFPDSTISYHVNGWSVHGCYGADTIQVTVDSFYEINISGDTAICEGDSVQLFADISNISWFPSQGLSDTTAQYAWASPGNSTVYYAQPYGGVCEHDRDTIVVSVNPLPILITINDTFICQPDTLMIWANGANSYNWFPMSALDNPSASKPLASPNTNTTYYVVGTSAQGCSNMDSVEINVFPPNQVNCSDTIICKGEIVNLGTTSYFDKLYPMNYTDTTSGQIISQPDSTVHYIGIENRGLCPADTTYINITVNDVPDVTAGNDTVVDSSSKVNLVGTTSVSDYYWTPSNTLSCTNCLNPLATPLNTTTYYLYADNNGCISYDSVVITLSTRCGKLYVPNAFTPNGDGLNDGFGLVIDEGNFNLQHFRIFNRWGELVFETDSPKEQWNGRFKETDQPLGVYIYHIVGSCNGEVKEKKGNLTLIR